jgi:CDP-glucose 4,6-dehydratase
MDLMHQALITPEYWAGQRVLLTWYTGFKGSWLALWLSELGAQVTGVWLEPVTDPHLFEQLQLEWRLHHHLADIRDPEALAEITASCEPEVVLHLAAQPLVRRSYRDPLGTWSTNGQGRLNLLEALKPLQQPCAVVMVTTDKVYANQEWDYGYREHERLVGHSPYSASKAGAELAIATARAGNVIAGRPIGVRNSAPTTRPWQHVLEPLGGYLRLAEAFGTAVTSSQAGENPYGAAFNFGPALEANRSVRQLIEKALSRWQALSEPGAFHEAVRLHLQIDKGHHQLGWQPRLPFATMIQRTMDLYRRVASAPQAAEASCLADLEAYAPSQSILTPASI